MIKLYQLIFLTLFISGCMIVPSLDKRNNTAEQLVDQHAWRKQVVKTVSFDLMSFVPSNPIKDSTLTVYIEGDGLAWISSRKPSSDPTPINPVSLKLALNHPNSNVAYLARPCQYLMDKLCETKYWTSHRFSPEVINASNEAVERLKQQFSATRLSLIGYSGGGAVATILAAQRDDVVKLITVAGNIDHKAWTAFHHVSPLIGSLNSVDYQKQLAKMEQVHFVGEDDTVIPPFLANDFVADLPTTSNAKVIVVEDQTHDCCWESKWIHLLKSIDTLNY